MRPRLPKKRLSTCDVILCVGLIFCAAFILVLRLRMPAGSAVRIVSDSGTQTYPLSSDRIISVESASHHLSVVIENGEVFVSDSDCPDHICEKTGRISKAGYTIVCVPARVLVTVTGGEEADYAIR